MPFPGVAANPERPSARPVWVEIQSLVFSGVLPIVGPAPNFQSLFWRRVTYAIREDAFSSAAVVAMTVASTVHGQSITQYGKAAWAAGTYPGGPNAARYYGRSYVGRPMMAAPAPTIATTPATGERRTFSAEPSTVQPAAPVAPAAPAAGPCPGK